MLVVPAQTGSLPAMLQVGLSLTVTVAEASQGAPPPETVTCMVLVVVAEMGPLESEPVAVVLAASVNVVAGG